MRWLLIIFIFLSTAGSNVNAQCTTLGQTPASAFPVCGTTVFEQSNVPICSSNNLFVPGCSGDGADYENKNPFWYKFTCYLGGTLSFTITPNTNSDDYDWQLFDITGRNPNDVFSVRSLVVAGNWSGSSGPTGASPSGSPGIECASSPSANTPTFSQMPTLILGHEYLLLISHFTDTQSGYSLTFNNGSSGAGTASITDPKLPKMESAIAPCDASSLVVSLNKEMKCSSISTGEFTISPPLATVTGISGIGCSAGFDMDKVTLTLSNQLPPGVYQVKIKNGTDGTTLVDYCDNNIPVGDSVELVVLALVPTPMDSLTKPACAPQTLELVFKKQIRCNSIAASGSDFSVTGSYPVTVTGASGECTNGLTNKIIVQLNAPLYTAGNFQIRLQQGTDGSTIIDECGQETLAGAVLNFSIKDTVNADFTYRTTLGCTLDTVDYFHNGNNTVNSWLWNFDNLNTSIAQNPSVNYNVFGNHQTQLIVSNGVCYDTSAQTVFLRNTLKANFDATLLVCPNDPAIFKDLSEDASPGNDIVAWSWNFSNGNTSNLQNPPNQFYNYSAANYYTSVQLIVTDFLGCKDTARLNLNILNNCYIAVPTAFTPNADGLNDFLFPLNAYKTTNLTFSVFNRLGQRVFYTQDWTRKWDGRFKGQGADPGTYVWMLDYFNLQTNKKVFQKGYTVLIR